MRTDISWAEALFLSGKSPFFRQLQSSLTAVSTIEGKQCIMFGGNNYLGLTTHPKVIKGAQDAIGQYGTGCTGSRFMNGTSCLHIELESRLADFYNKEDALVFSAGYLANLGVLSAIGTRNTYLVSDRMNHASIIDGQKASNAKSVRFKHNDPDSLSKCLSRLPANACKIIVIEGIHSMYGDICPLPGIIEVAKQFNARIYLDDAHGVGVLGSKGRGTASHFGVEDEVDIIMGTFSKSYASYGGFVVSDRETIQYIRKYTRAFMFTASLPPANIGTVLAVLDILNEEPIWLKRLWQNIAYLNDRLLSASILKEPAQTPIFPLIIGDKERTYAAWCKLFERGIYTNAVFPPAVPPNQSLLRLSMMATIRKSSIDYLVDTLEETYAELGINGIGSMVYEEPPLAIVAR